MTRENGENQGEVRKHNAKARGDAIKKAHRELLKLEADRDEINEDIREVRNTLKADLGITLRAFDDARRLIRLEEEERSKAQDDFREAWEALSPGQSIDWVQVALERGEAEQPTA